MSVLAKRRLNDQTAIIKAAGDALRSHLNIILGQSQILLSRAKNYRSEDRHLIDSVLGSSGGLRQILLDTLDIVDVKTNRLKVSEDEHLLHDMLKDVVADQKAVARQLGVNLDVKLKASTHGWFAYDQVRVRQCIKSLLGQCVRQSSEGTINFFATVNKSRHKGRGLQITIIDPTAEIHQHQANAYFAPKAFFRNPHLKKESAWRLSVLLARLIARRLKGDITVSSKHDGNLTFKLFIPMTFVKKAGVTALRDGRKHDTAEAETPEIATKLKKEKRSYERSSIKVLISDDDKTNRMVLEGMLRSCGYQHIVKTANGAELLEQLATHSFDIVLTDLHMPMVCGFEAAQKIRSSKQKWSSIPIIAVSAAETRETRAKALRSGINSFIAKPVLKDELYVVMKEQLDTVAALPGKRAA
ncbi:MAG: response regulator [Pseudomonadota bacterium]